MKKRNIIMIIMAAAMLLASCGKTPAEETTLYEEPATTSTRSTVVTEPSPTITPVGYVAEVPEEEMYADLSQGMKFTYGTYEGEPIEWVVLSRSGNTCIVVTRDVVTTMPYAADGTFTSWADSDIRVWLNTDFYTNCFTDDERARIKNVPGYSNPDIPNEDMVFLLGRDEVSEYETRFETEEASCEWWLRSYAPAGTYERADYCSTTGEKDLVGRSITDELGVRPAMKFYCGSDTTCLEPVPAYCTPFPTPTPAPSSEDDPASDNGLPEIIEPELPDVMPTDGSLSDRDNLVNYYENHILETLGQSPLGPDEFYIYYDGSSMTVDSELSLTGAITYVIDDFDGDGDDDMIVPVMVEEAWVDPLADDPHTLSVVTSEHFYRLHILLCETDNGEVSITDDFAMMVITGDDEANHGYINGDQCMDGFESLCPLGRAINIYTVNRGDHVNILITSIAGFSVFGDGSICSAYELEVSDGELRYTSAFVTPGMGSDDHMGYQYYFENGEITSREAYYQYPEDHGADPDMIYGLDLYLDRIGLDNELSEINDHMWYYEVTDEDAHLVAGMYLGPVDEATVDAGDGGTGYPYGYWVDHE